MIKGEEMLRDFKKEKEMQRKLQKNIEIQFLKK